MKKSLKKSILTALLAVFVITATVCVFAFAEETATETVYDTKIDLPRYVYDTSISDATLGVGSKIALPVATIYDCVNTSINGVPTALTVLHDGVAVQGFDKATDYGKDFVLSTAGKYEFVYSQRDCDQTESQSFTVVAVENVPSIDCTQRLPYTTLDGYTLEVDKTSFVLDGQNVDTDIFVYFPNGNAYKYQSVQLTEKGLYQVEYRTEYNGKVYRYVKDIYVYGANFTYQGKGLAQYGLSTFSSQLADIDKTKADAGKMGEVSGVNVTLQKNAVLCYDNLVDLSQIGADEKLVEFYVAPTGAINVYFYVQLVDENDPDNYVSVMFSSYRDTGTTYRTWLNASASGLGEYVGVYHVTNPAVCYVNRPFGGSYIGSDISGVDPSRKQFYQPLAFAYDETQMQVKGMSTATGIVADFDDVETYFERVYDANGALAPRTGYFPKAWKGFSTDKVYVKLYAEGDFNNLDVTITKIGNDVLEPSFRSALQPTTYLQKAIWNNGSYTFDGNNVPNYGEADFSVPYTTALNGKQGLNLCFTNYETFTFNSLIDLNKYSFNSASDVVNNKIISFFGYAEGSSATTNTKIYVDLIDENNPDNYLSVLFNRCQEGQIVYAYTAVPSIGQKFVGLNSETEFGTNNYGTAHVERYTSTSGAKTTTCIDECRGSAVVSVHYRELSFAYDQTTKRVYTYNAGTPWLIADLDDNTTKCQILANGTTNQTTMVENAWQGFSSSKVYLRIRTEGTHEGNLHLLVTQIGDVDLSAIDECQTQQQNLSLSLFSDYDTDSLPNAIVGQSYNLPKATCNDLAGNNIAVKVVVEKPNGAQIIVKDDAFIPDTVGKFTVHYKATDKFGFVTKKSLSVFAVSKQSVEELSVDVDGLSLNVTTGVQFDLPTFVVSGGIGNSNVIVNVLFDGQVVDTFDANKILSYLLTRNGNYTFNYVATDFVGQTATTDVTVTATASENPLFVGEADLPQVMFNGWTYNLPQLYAVDYVLSEPKTMLAKVKVFDDNERVLDGNVYVPSVNQNKQVTIRYFVDTTSGHSHKDYTVDVRIGNEGDTLNALNYFTASGATLTYSENGVVVNATQNNACVTFSNKLLVSSIGFGFNFNINKSTNNYERLNIYLQDSVDKSVTIKLSLIKPAMPTEQSDNANIVTDFQINNVKKSYSLNGSWWNDSRAFDIAYSPATQCLESSNGLNVRVDTTLDGNEFHGFASNYVYVTFELVGVEQSSQVTLTKICNQSLSANNVNEDWTAPQIAILGEYGGFVLKGQTVFINRALTGDVFSQSAEITVKVQCPNGTATSVDGISLNNADASRSYEFVANDYGNYTVTYTGYDSFRNKATMVYSVYVNDVTGPQISIGNIPQQIWLNNGTATLTLPTITATDDSGCECQIKINFKNPLGIMTEVTDGKLTFNGKGVYVLYVDAYDNSGNVTVQTVEIIAKGE